MKFDRVIWACECADRVGPAAVGRLSQINILGLRELAIDLHRPQKTVDIFRTSDSLYFNLFTILSYLLRKYLCFLLL